MDFGTYEPKPMMLFEDNQECFLLDDKNIFLGCTLLHWGKVSKKREREIMSSGKIKAVSAIFNQRMSYLVYKINNMLHLDE